MKDYGKRELPDFRDTGRYVIDVREVRQRDAEYHDTEYLAEECQVAQIPEDSQSRFNNAKWAEQRGYRKCRFCQK